MRVFASTLTSIFLLALAFICQPAYAQTKAIKNPDSSTTIIKRSPKVLAPQRATPGLTNKQYQGGGTALPATHCNGTCACTGTDCSSEWLKQNCKDHKKADCSGKGGTDDLVCSCVKKVTRN